MMSQSRQPLHPLTFAFMGGGNGSHVGANVCALNPDLRTYVLTNKADRWNQYMDLTMPDNSVIKNNKIDKISKHPEEIIPEADVIIISAPVHGYESMLASIAPYLKENCIVGTSFCQGHVGLMIQHALKVAGKDRQNITAFGMKYIPWQAKIIEYGKHAHMVGKKSSLEVATYPNTNFNVVAEKLERVFSIPCVQIPFMATCLITSNQILHPARYFGQFKNWDMKTPLKDRERYKEGSLYTDMDQVSAAILQQLDDEIMGIKVALENQFPLLDLSSVIPCKERIRNQYGDQVKDYTTLLSTFNTAEMYKKSKFAMKEVEGGVVPNIVHRHFQDDIPYGLIVLKDIADRLGVKVETINHMIMWHQKYMKKHYTSGPLFNRLDGEHVNECGVIEAYGLKDGIEGLEQLIEEDVFTDSQYKEEIDKKLKLLNRTNAQQVPVFCFDVDETVWNFTAEHEQNKNLSKSDVEAKLFKDVPGIIEVLSQNQVSLTLASRTWVPALMETYLEQLGLRKYFHHCQLYPSGLGRCMNSDWPPIKVPHFLNLKEAYPGRKIVFFDNEMKNVKTATEMGVKAFFTPQGLMWKHIYAALQ